MAWIEEVRIDLKKYNLFKHLIQDELKWWNIIHMADSNMARQNFDEEDVDNYLVHVWHFYFQPLFIKMSKALE